MTTTMTTDLELLRTQVALRRVGALDRDPMTSKVRRFVPLPARIQ
jgi:hypothetical protein